MQIRQQIIKPLVLISMWTLTMWETVLGHRTSKKLVETKEARPCSPFPIAMGLFHSDQLSLLFLVLCFDVRACDVSNDPCDDHDGDFSNPLDDDHYDGGGVGCGDLDGDLYDDYPRDDDDDDDDDDQLCRCRPSDDNKNNRHSKPGGS